ncbi:hypothetical protein J2Z79_001214 [Symbiobacterium terraclitae]|uniref:Uncharacterized protein n=1 Tax=Symbiobacterium terraclitae TaxID=557451 RepID=A0ABS4JQL6_9FIRM|nr:outer spore coat protein CotE [Symbiobacterium terraclitae]MBP2017829.1 hypothetical protein [Symbiobacterium terraclitae]
MSSIRLQEIVTRAVVGRCDRRVVWSRSAPAEDADCVLGVHVSSTAVTVEPGAEGPEVHLTAVCEVWCGTADRTRVERLTCTHAEPANVPLIAQVVGDVETTCKLVGGVRCVEAEVRDGLIQVTLESRIALEAVGRARLWVKAYDLLTDGEVEDLDSSVSSDFSDSSASVSEPAGAFAPEVVAEHEAIVEPDEVAAEAEAEVEPQPEEHVATLNGVRQHSAPEPRRTAVSRFQRYSGLARVSIVQ